MLKKSLFIISMLLTFQSLEALHPSYGKSAVSPGHQVGRLGNCLLNYCLSKWVAWQTKLPCHHTPLKYGQHKEFAYSLLEPLAIPRNFRKKIYLQGSQFKQTIQKFRTKNSLFIVPFQFSAWGRRSPEKMVRIFKQDKPFIEELKKKIKPVRTIEEIQKPPHAVSVALHVRKGGGYPADHAGIYKRFPCKFPPDVFYIEQLIKLSFILEHAPMYVYIFTDDPQPEKIAQRFSAMITLPNIEFDCRKSGNAHNNNIIEDFFNLAKFDYLIRPGSSYTWIAEIIGNHKMVIYPSKANVDHEKRLFFITEVGINIYDPSLKEFDRFMRKPLSRKKLKSYLPDMIPA